MPRIRKPYPPEFREQLVALVRAGRTPEDLTREFEPTAQSISNWVAQADRDAGRRTDGLTTAERAELTRLRVAPPVCCVLRKCRRGSLRPTVVCSLWRTWPGAMGWHSLGKFLEPGNYLAARRC